MTSVVSVQQERTRRLGASEVSVALALSPYEPPLSLWCRLTGRQDGKVTSEPMEWGNKLEPVIRAEYVERHHVNVFVPKTSILHPTFAILGCTPDGIILEGDDTGHERWVGGLQCKAPGHYQMHRWGSSDDPETPIEIITQVASEMACTGLPWVDVAALIAGQTYVERRIHRDAELEADILEGLAEFWRYVETDTPPPVDGSDAYTKHLKARIQRIDAIVPATARADDLAKAWREKERDMKRAEIERDHLRNMFLSEMVNAGAQKMRTSVGVIGAFENSGRRSWEALAKDLASRIALRGEPTDIDEEIKRFTSAPEEKWTIRRPNNWTAKESL